MLANRKLGVYIWLVAVLPIAGFFGLISCTYFHTNRASYSLEKVENTLKGIGEKSDRSFPQKQQQLLNSETTQIKNALGAANLTLLVGAAIELVFMAVAVYSMSALISRRFELVAREITTSSTDIAATMGQQERAALKQAASVNQTTTTMDQLGASSLQSAQQAEAAVADARSAMSLALGGTKAVQRTLEDMSTLKGKVEAIAAQILRLSEQTSQIRNISGLVSDLATQTNMLALNAAVEAVRAGEHGKGFAVVASEIRKLADQSQKSTEKINSLVSDIQSAINSTVMVTDEGRKTVDASERIAQETAEAFKGVAEAINNISVSTQQISLSAKQQAIAIQQVVDAMNALNQVAIQTAEGITQVKIGTERLNNAAQNLKTIA